MLVDNSRLPAGRIFRLCREMVLGNRHLFCRVLGIWIEKNDIAMQTYELSVLFYEDYVNSENIFTWKILSVKNDRWTLNSKTFHAAKEEAEKLFPAIIKDAPENFTRCWFFMSGKGLFRDQRWEWNLNKQGKIMKEGQDKF